MVFFLFQLVKNSFVRQSKPAVNHFAFCFKFRFSPCFHSNFPIAFYNLYPDSIGLLAFLIDQSETPYSLYVVKYIVSYKTPQCRYSFLGRLTCLFIKAKNVIFSWRNIKLRWDLDRSLVFNTLWALINK